MESRVAPIVEGSLTRSSSASARPTARKSASSKTIATAQLQSPTISTFFTQSQLALALAISKAKPEGFATDEYCQQLRANIKPGKASSAENNRHIDTAEFWREQYTKIHTERRALGEKVRRLEEQQRQWQLDSTTSGHQSLNTSTKRPALFQDPEIWIDENEETSQPPDQNIILTLSSYVFGIARHRNALDKLVKASSFPDHIESISQSTTQALHLLEEAIFEISIPLQPLRCGDETQASALLRQLMLQIALCYRSCFDALTELCKTILGRKKRFEIIHRLVTFFQKSLEHLRTACCTQAENELAETRRTRNKRSRIDHEYAFNNYTTEMLVSIAQMEWKAGQVGHKDILEGILFLVLHHTGRLLSNAAFKEHVASSNLVGNITKTSPEILPGAAKLETQCLILVLHATLGRSSSRKELVANVLAEHTLEANVQRRSNAENPEDLLCKARKMIQSSLVKSALGGTELQGLKMPTPPDGEEQHALQLSTQVEMYGPEWLLESVWALVGWDLAVQ